MTTMQAGGGVPLTAEVEGVRDRADVSRQIRMVVVFAITALLGLAFVVTTSDAHVLVALKGAISRDYRGTMIDGRPVLIGSLVLSVLALVAAGLNRVPRGVLGMIVFALVGLGFLLAFFVWNFADQTLARPVAIVSPLPGTIRLATPLILGALAGCLCERSGVINIAIEGQLLMGAFFASVIAGLSYSNWLGLLGAIGAGVFMAALLAVFALRYRINQVVLGVVLTALGLGLTSFLLSQIPDGSILLDTPDPFSPVAIPGLYRIPLLGPALFDQNAIVYIALVSVVFVTVVLFQTRWGLRVRAVGEHPRAADTVGIKVNRMRWQAVLLGGVFAGIGGAYFTIGSQGEFSKNMSAGNGFIALAAVIMGRWHPVGATLAALLFGFSLTLKDQIGFVAKVPSDFLAALPYLVTIIAVAGFVGRVRPPAADGDPYTKG